MRPRPNDGRKKKKRNRVWKKRLIFLHIPSSWVEIWWPIKIHFEIVVNKNWNCDLEILVQVNKIQKQTLNIRLLKTHNLLNKLADYTIAFIVAWWCLWPFLIISEDFLCPHFMSKTEPGTVFNGSEQIRSFLPNNSSISEQQLNISS